VDPNAVALRGLYKRFGQKIAVCDLSLDVPRGSFFGLVGPNGAAKTTTMRMATGLLRPDAGLVWIDGYEVWKDRANGVAVKAHIGARIAPGGAHRRRPGTRDLGRRQRRSRPGLTRRSHLAALAPGIGPLVVEDLSEAVEHLDQIGLVRHYLVDVLV
jgi:ABC-type cobalamin/Fe3+-siderophores transport system ATPase subunit